MADDTDEASQKPGFVRMMTSQTQKSKLKRSRTYEDNSLRIFSTNNKFRIAVISIVDSKLFERALLFIVFVNAIFLGAEAAYPSDEMEQVQFDADIVFICLFTIELILKLIAYGAWAGQYSYFRDPWNWLDFIVTTTGYLRFFPALYDIQAINRLRLLRPLRAVTSVRRLRVLIQSMINSLPMLLDVFLLFVFVLFVYGLVGLQFYQGRFHYRCVTPGDPTIPGSDSFSLDSNPLCSPDPRFGLQCTAPLICSDHAGGLANGTRIDNPEYFIGFDNIFIAFITIGQIMSLEGWSSVMYHAEDTASKFHDMFFISLVMIGSFFMVNLIVAVILIRFQQVKDIEEFKLGGEKQIESQSSSNNLIRLRSRNKLETVKSLKDIRPETISKNDPVLIVVHGRVKRRNELTYFHLACLRAKSLFDNPKYELFWLAVIVINGILLATPYQGASQTYLDALRSLNIVFNSMYTVEMTIMLLALGRTAFTHVLRVTDLLVVVANWIFIFAGLGASWDMLLAIRLFDLLRLLSGVRALQRLIRAIETTIKDILCLTIILMLYVYIGALLGVSALRHDSGEVWDEYSERPNYDTLWMAMLATFQLLTRENWNSLLQQSKPGIASAYFPIMVVVGNYLFMSLFLAMLIGNMRTQEAEIDTLGWWNSWCKCCRKNEASTQPLVHEETVNIEMADLDFEEKKDTVLYTEREKTLQELITPRRVHKANSAAKKREQLMESYLMDDNGKKSTNPVRRLAARIHVSYAFDVYTLGIMAFTCGFLIWDAPKETNEGIAVYFDGILFAASFVEMAIKVVARGAFRGKQPYFKEFMNCVDFLVLFSFLLLLLGHTFGFYEKLKAFRVIRALRPVRLIQRFESMRVIARSIGRAIPEMLNVAVVGVLFYAIAGIIGLHIFRGKWGRCMYEDSRVETNMTIFNYDIAECNALASQGISGYSWKNQMGPAHFDHFGAAFLTAFEIGCVENWPAYLLLGLDSVPYGEKPRVNALPFAGLYFVLLLILGAFFITSLFIGVVADEYSRNYDVITGASGLTVAQRQWLETRKLIIQHPPKRVRPPATSFWPAELKFRRRVFEFVTHPYYPYLVLALTTANIIALACWHATQSATFEAGLNVVHAICVLLFLVECLVHLYGLGPRQYFGSKWCIFDAVTTFGAVVAFVIEELLAGIVDTGVHTKLLKMFLVFKIGRFLYNSHRLRKMMNTLIFCLPALLNICLITLLTLFIYAVAGMNLFGLVRHGVYIDRHANFERFDRAIVTLVRSLTGESWQGLMHDVMNTDFCTVVTCGSPVLGLIYFLSFHFIIDYLLINLFVAAVLKHFENELFKESPDTVQGSSDEQGVHSATGLGNLVGEECLENFAESWLRYCTEADDYLMNIQSFNDFLMDLPPPMGVHCKLCFDIDMVSIESFLGSDFIEAIASAGQIEAKSISYTSSLAQDMNAVVCATVALLPGQNPEDLFKGLKNLLATHSRELTKFCETFSTKGVIMKPDNIHILVNPFAVAEGGADASKRAGNQVIQFTLALEDGKAYDESLFIHAVATGLNIDSMRVRVVSYTRAPTLRAAVSVGPISKVACRKLKANILRDVRNDLASTLGLEVSYVRFGPAAMKMLPGKDLNAFMANVPMSLVDDSHVHCFEAASALAFRVMSEAHKNGTFDGIVSMTTLFQRSAKNFEEEVRLIDRKNEMNKLINFEVQRKYPKLAKAAITAPVILVIYTLRIQRFWRKRRAQRLGLQEVAPEQKEKASSALWFKKTMSFKLSGSTTKLTGKFSSSKRDLTRDSPKTTMTSLSPLPILSEAQLVEETSAEEADTPQSNAGPPSSSSSLPPPSHASGSSPPPDVSPPEALEPSNRPSTPPPPTASPQVTDEMSGSEGADASSPTQDSLP